MSHPQLQGDREQTCINYRSLFLIAASVTVSSSTSYLVIINQMIILERRQLTARTDIPAGTGVPWWEAPS